MPAAEPTEPLDVFRLAATDVVGVSPLPGDGVAADDVPANVRAMSAASLERFLPTTVAESLAERWGSVNTNAAQNNPFQPDLQYRGFTASPLLGNPQGLAVYQNGVRLNETFGETVNWDLVPQRAVASIELIPGSNPVFGLNALGGALAIAMKDGFSFEQPGAEVEAYGGSFGRWSTALEAGGMMGDLGLYLAGQWLEEDGWRDHSPSTLRQLYADATWRSGGSRLGISFTGADNDLTGNGAAPVELLAADRSAVFTYPDSTRNRLAQVVLRGAHELDGGFSLQGTAYVRSLDTETTNGDGFDAEPCEDDPSVLCNDDGPELVDRTGAPVPSSVLTGEPGVYNRTDTGRLAWGGALQGVWEATLGWFPNQLLVGASADAGDVDFSSDTELGSLTPDRTVAGLGLFISAGREVRVVDLRSTSRFYGVYASDTLHVADDLSLTLAGRFNRAEIVLRDRLGDDLDSDHVFERFNPAIGLTYAVRPWLGLYAGYSESNRAPSAAELGCADPEAPCRLPNAFVADPPLEQVVAGTVELGARGATTLGDASRSLRWRLAFFRTDLQDDILFVASSGFGRGYFQNAGDTRRQGIELDFSGNVGALGWFASYALVDATFCSPLTVASPNNPHADESGEIRVEPGDRLPGIPLHQAKVGVMYAITDRWSVDANLVAASGQVLRGDEANLDATVPGYWVVDLGMRYAITEWLEAFVRVENVFDTDYETFGLYAETGEVFLAEAPDATNPRAYGAAPPIGAFVGVRVLL